MESFSGCTFWNGIEDLEKQRLVKSYDHQHEGPARSRKLK
ncbi:hypothetical protein SCH4B_2768 [Ruegeria sp. TrichCH4B]|nr:hypothetical protein SCH4B_2768 [Ruegeria sp. TrichCH4B]